MSTTQAQALENQKVNLAIRQCENENGQIKEGKVTEWALLQIVHKLTGIHYALVQSNIARHS